MLGVGRRAEKGERTMKRLLQFICILFLFVADVAFCGNVLQSEGGRYAFGQISEYARHQYMLDTKTGMLWILTEDKGGGNLQLQPIPYRYAGDEFLSPPSAPLLPFPQSNGAISKKKK